MNLKNINIIAIILLFATFLTLQPLNYSFWFLTYFLLLFLGGLGLTSRLNFTKHPGIFYITALLVGIITNYLIFFGAHYLNLTREYTPFITAIAIIFYRRPKLEKILNKKLYLVIILIILSLVLVSDKLTNTTEGFLVQDPRHPTTELSFAQSLGTMFPVEYLSYQGKEFKYHFGFGIVTYQLVNYFHQNPLPLIYTTLPAFFIMLLMVTLSSLSEVFLEKKRKWFVFAILFSTLSLPIGTIIEFFNLLTSSNLPVPVNPYFIFTQFIKMGSFSLAILITLILFLVMKDEKTKLLQIILLTGLAMTKITFFIIFALAYATYSVIKYGNLKSFLQRNLLLVPGTLYFWFFVKGAHQHNIWAIFPGSLKITSTGLNSISTNTLLSVLFAGFWIGLGFFYLIPKIKNWKNTIKSPNLLPALIILFSFLIGLLLVEVTEANHKQFLFPGYIFLMLFTYRKLLTSKKMIFPVVIIILINATAVGIFFMLPTYKSTFQAEDNNPLAEFKIKAINVLPQVTHPLQQNCYYSKGLIGALEFLSRQPGKVLVFNVLAQGCENYQVKTWEEIVNSKNAGFIRTSVSGKVTPVEHYQFKGILTEPDYCDRIVDNIHLYNQLTGNTLPEFTGFPKYENLSYHSYFKLFSSKNFYTYNSEFNICIQEKLSQPEISINKFIEKYQVNYILVEQPVKETINNTPLAQIFSSGEVSVYKTALP